MKIWDLIINIKNDYLKEFNSISYEQKDNKTCLEIWVNELNNQEYKNILSFIKIKQKNNFLLLKYKDFEKLFYNENLSYYNFWHLYDGIFRECRGFVFDIEKEKIVCLPYEKFFNINEQEETQENKILEMLNNAKKVEFSNKLDGTLIISRFYENNIFSCTSGSMDEKITYPLKWANKLILEKKEYQNLISNFPDWTFLFECITSNNQLVVIYNENQYGLHLIGMRNVNTGELKSYSEIIELAKKYNISVTENYKMSFDEILASRNKYKHTEKEGYVMYLDGILVKIKCDEYMLLHKKGKDTISKNTILKAVYQGTIDDILSSSKPELKIVIEETLMKIEKYCMLMELHTENLFQKAPKEKIEFYKYLKTIPKMFTKFLNAKYKNKEYSYLVELEAGESTSFIRYSELEKRINILENKQ